jgi:4-hydroxybutyrate CoA-transferase
MHRLTPEEAVCRLVRPGQRVLLGTAAGVATTLQQALITSADQLTGLRLVGGMQLGGYAFMDAVRDGRWSFDTWHVMPPIREDVAGGRVGFHLVRGSAVPDAIRRLSPDVFLTVVSPPGRDGCVSLGASVSYALDAVEAVPTVIAEVNPEMPDVRGHTRVPIDRFAAFVDADGPLQTYASRAPSEVDARIAAHVRSLIPDDATVQIGIGGVPEALVSTWADDPPVGITLFGMGIDAMIDLLERLDRPAAYVGGELLGTRRLYEFANDNPAVEQYPISHVLSVPRLAGIPRFVSVIGAVEIDLAGQVNAEWASGRQRSGPGGGFDFVDAANLSPGGLSVIAMRSTNSDGTASSIVSELQHGAPVTIPRHSVHVVVTEHGVADLRGRTLVERAERLAAIAAPQFRAALGAPEEPWAA